MIGGRNSGFFIFLLSLLGFLAGCGGDAAPKNPPPAVETSPVVDSGESKTLQPNTNENKGSLGSSEGEGKVLTLGRIPFSNATLMVRDHQEFLNILAKEVGVEKVELKLAQNYDHVLEKLAKGEIDFAWLGTGAYPKAHEKFGVEPLVKIKRYGADFYRGQIVVRADSGMKTLNDLKGKNFGFVDAKSASGYMFPKALLLQNGLDPEKDFSKTQFLGKHDNVVLNVFLGKIDAGACYDDARGTLKDPEKEKELFVLAKTDKISNEPIVSRKNLDPDLREKFKKALFQFNDPKYKEILKKVGNVEGFSEAVDSDYDYFRKVLSQHPELKDQ